MKYFEFEFFHIYNLKKGERDEKCSRKTLMKVNFHFIIFPMITGYNLEKCQFCLCFVSICQFYNISLIKETNTHNGQNLIIK